MIYPRLKVAKDLLADDGVIFISIGDEEVRNMKIVCDEVFGESNFAAQFLWTKTATPPALSHKCRKTVEYVLCYEKVGSNRRFFGSLLDGGDAPLLNTGNPIKELVFPKGAVRFKFVENTTIEKVVGRYPLVAIE
jgi:adenine-specific DNA-methyltransferase